MVRGFCSTESTAGQSRIKPSATPSRLSNARRTKSFGVSFTSPALTLQTK